ncbi:signal recognition particle SRP9/SRP14 subunit [Irpex rosettiformis]|uniref:Signal recognition particle SRP9/SRP14 subunit n=1 Tax=Irpex rosettiformis TaxID=378272 RepID=A0ACB8UIG2_9APHY|nr:signal recognition particle SRP9/SRP14 subunit [Irpex rosettiformis]
MQLVDYETFFKQLAALFEASKDKGSVWLTHKRLTHDGEDASTAPDPINDTKEYPCLVRVTNGKEVNFSTRVEAGELDKFHAEYGALLKASISPLLRKRDKKREKQRAEEVAHRKKRLAENVIVEGSKRGAGRRKRTRLLKRAIRQEEQRKRVHEREEARLTKAKASP